MIDKVYAFNYCDCIYESSYATVSLHRTPEGAEKAMNIHKEEKRKFFLKLYEDEDDNDIEFGEFEAWCVEPVEILE